MSAQAATRVVALVDDLIDRSKISAAAPSAVASREITAVDTADVVVIDLARHAAALPAVRERAPGAFVVAFGRHDDVTTLEAARAGGADRVLTRARFFADVAGSLDPDQVPPSDR